MQIILHREQFRGVSTFSLKHSPDGLMFSLGRAAKCVIVVAALAALLILCSNMEVLQLY